jgi:ABC-type transport system involved in multi-copper enzyme maturation permease subunit
MRILNPNPTGSSWNPISGISGVICAIFAFLLWAGITPSSLFAWRKSTVNRRRGATVWIGALLSASMFLSGYSFYSWIHPSHPIAAWFSVFLLGLLVITTWSVLLRPQPKSVMRPVRTCVLRCRLQLLTWQELTAVLPRSLQKFLAAKYGITP